MKKILIALFILVLGVSVQATYITTPYTFVNKQIIPADKTNANFSAYETGLSDGTKDANLYNLYINSVLFADLYRNTYFNDMRLTGNATILGNQTVSGNQYIQGNLTITGNATILGVLSWGAVTITANNFYFTTPSAEVVWVDPVYLDSVYTPTASRLSTSGQEYIGFVQATKDAVHFQIENPLWASTNTPDLVLIYTVSGSTTVLTTVNYTITYNDVGNDENMNAAGTSLTGSWTPSVSAGYRQEKRFPLGPITAGNSLQIYFERDADPADGFAGDIQVLNFGIEYDRARL